MWCSHNRISSNPFIYMIYLAKAWVLSLKCHDISTIIEHKWILTNKMLSILLGATLKRIIQLFFEVE